MLAQSVTVTRTKGRAIAALVCAVVVLLASVSPALGWELSKSTNGVIINRQSDDSTAALAVGFIYYGYKGGEESWSATYSPVVSTSYNHSVNIGTLFPIGSSGDAIEIPLVEGYRLQAVMLSQSGIGQRWFGVIKEPLLVDVQNTRLPVSTVGTVCVSSMPTVSVGTSFAVAGTLPVDVVDVSPLGPEPFDSVKVVGLGFLVIAGALSFDLWRTNAVA